MIIFSCEIYGKEKKYIYYNDHSLSALREGALIEVIYDGRKEILRLHNVIYILNNAQSNPSVIYVRAEGEIII